MSRRNYTQPSTTKSQQSHFAQVPRADIKRSRIDRSHGLKTSFGGGSVPWWTSGNPLIPCFVDEVLPGDSFHMKSTGFARLATPLFPIMDNLNIDVHYFFVPNRLVWDNWQRFMGERDNPDDDPNDFTVPQVQVETAVEAGTQDFPDRLSYYFGLPMTKNSVAPPDNFLANALPFRAYRLIWNEWYRDENLQDSVDNPTGDADPMSPQGPTISAQLLPRGKRKDYFTSALPWPQKGEPVLIPMDVQGSGTSLSPLIEVRGRYDASPGGNVGENMVSGTGEIWAPSPLDGAVSGQGFEFSAVPEQFVNEATINDLRTAFQIQKLLERDARGGTRYTELIRAHFNVTSPDSRLQRPEYLGGATSRVSVNPIANTAGGERPEGSLGGFATSVNQASFSKSFTEHGYIIGLVSYRADLTYQRGIERMWTRATRYDFYWPALAHLGEQAILKREINYRGEATDLEVFGYQERYGEYRFKPSRVTGLFNSDATNSLDAWHLAQDFPVTDDLPLNENFIQELPPIERAIAVPTEPFFIADFWFDLKCDRPMPIYAVPGLVDHF